ncbi:hypothetical protein A3D77_02290 [Candidatus Gottesmanbacteria bacterium RIFCSPHIGHO2_02_FULL_39_11]|uniref:Uncharacterized protein n=1 Tax=Candidatus Gottesmanbacteria bacterium RIFCSPHIGHO2_02_FULL_39_11 TaxID=1798382 RepID=A0A1F5ZUV9_9BACT|nr:MAG: hypothetical protein A3D77_02290 [Candidatus Gottesmanbacteria bacterium RIFCSPHIGHO2_02_FULL_39_11]
MEYTAQYYRHNNASLGRKKFILINSILVCLIIGLSVLQVIILNHDSTSGEKLTLLNREINKYSAEIVDLDQEIASFSALSSVSQKASESGFLSNTQLVTLTTESPLAYKTR